MLRSRCETAAAILAGVCLSASTLAQQGRVYTAADYVQAEKFTTTSVEPLVFHAIEDPTWLPDGRMWYHENGPGGVTTFMLVDPLKRTLAPAFDHARIAASLNAAIAANGGSERVDAKRLPISNLLLENNDHAVVLTIGEQQIRCDLQGTSGCGVANAAGRSRAASDISPDRKKAAFIRDHNLWVRDQLSGKETQLTTDGVEDYGYATDNSGWIHSDNPILVWSPDSRKIATFQQDQRKVGRMYLVNTRLGHPTLETWRYPLAGDANVTMIERVVVDVDSRKVVRLKMPPDQHRSTLCDDLSCRGGSGWDDVQWSDDSKHLAFASSSRDHKQVWLRLADPGNGEVREIMNESVPTFFESGNGKVNWHVLPDSNEVLWFSERDGWGQMYLYDLKTGKLKNQITHGEGNVTQVLHVDEKARTLDFLAVGKEPGRDPYYSGYYRIHFDGSGLKLLTPQDADHKVTASPDGHFFLDIASTPTTPASASIRDSDGNSVLPLPDEDITRLRAIGWKPLTPFTIKARDGSTDLYGYMFKPTDFDPTKKYPIVDRIYPGPQTNSCGSRSFSAAHADMQSLAELGFIVVCIDGMGTPWRSKAFHAAYYGDMADNTLPDQVSGLKQLAAQYPWIDIAHVGIYGHSGGGYAAAGAMFHFPNFFKVGISESGNHDNREYEDDWAEKWSGLVTKNPDGTSNYDSQANQAFAKNLQGHLLLMHGTMDDNVPPANTMLIVDALIKANKDFDLVMIPNAAHGYGAAANYATRRRWDYFVRYLANGVPPNEYQMKR